MVRGLMVNIYLLNGGDNESVNLQTLAQNLQLFLFTERYIHSLIKETLHNLTFLYIYFLLFIKYTLGLNFFFYQIHLCLLLLLPLILCCSIQ